MMFSYNAVTMIIKRLSFSLFFLFFLFCIANATSTKYVRVSDVHFRMIDERMEVFYDLPVNHDSIHVKIVFRKKSAPKFRYIPQFVSGDIGIGIYSGANRKIVWYYKKEPPSVFTGSGFYFEMKAKRIPVKQ